MGATIAAAVAAAAATTATGFDVVPTATGIADATVATASAAFWTDDAALLLQLPGALQKLRGLSPTMDLVQSIAQVQGNFCRGNW